MGWTALRQAPDISTLSVEQLVTAASSLPSRGKGADLVRHLSRSAAGSALLSASPLDFIYARNPLPVSLQNLQCMGQTPLVKHHRDHDDALDQGRQGSKWCGGNATELAWPVTIASSRRRQNSSVAGLTGITLARTHMSFRARRCRTTCTSITRVGGVASTSRAPAPPGG